MSSQAISLMNAFLCAVTCDGSFNYVLVSIPAFQAWSFSIVVYI